MTADGGSPAEVEGARHGRMPRRSAGRSAITLIASALAVLLVAGAAVAAFVVVDLYRGLQQRPPVELESERMLEGVPDIGAMEGGLTFFLAGSDKRPEDGAFGDPDEESGVLNDVNMLLHISQDHSHVEVVSFPRDLLVDVPECPDPSGAEGETLAPMYGVKLNSVLHYGGVGCVVATIEQLTGLTIPVAGVVEFYGVASLAEAVGGVEVCLAEPIDDPWSGLQLDAGTHSITGMTALAFLRSRHGVGDGSDLGRISNQQAFLSSLMRTIQGDGVLSDPVKLYAIAKAVLGNMQLSSYLQDPVTLISIARTLQDVDLSKIVFVQYPTAYTSDFGAVVPTESADALNAALVADQPLQLAAEATTDATYGTVPGEQPSAEASAPPTDAAPDAPPTDAPGEPPAEPPPTETPAQVLPDDITGQTGAEVRCSTANDR
ncbi:LytR family transcriptional regulator [Agromyces sp. CFH 90414]|uniref:LytR family transcriptional regulator n=1 Tax=Agromyces agglutinans TaxID=2662258 RepID=A0A6I2F5S5_9MICO|nr:LCP family protein [Agromyces agglutinans]MRG59694.1 LytR family transcriptional regulator [Agromyces agglutinans]